MRIRQGFAAVVVVVLLSLVSVLQLSAVPDLLKENNAVLLEQVQRVHRLSDTQAEAVRAIFRQSPVIGQGNPAVTKHPLSTLQCEEKLARAGVHYENAEFERICRAKYMSPLYDPAKEKPEDAKACIDQFEFPDIPCTYPVVWVRAREAASICEAMGKRLCDAHEWEGACAGALAPPDYPWKLTQGVSVNDAVERMRQAHNKALAGSKSWAYGTAYSKGVCGASSEKTAGCNGGDWKGCGSNTYPTGSFPDCRSALGVYDQHGNAAEHMNLPFDESQMASRGSKSLGYTEMKGSWFIFDTYYAHPDWARWRAPYWHGSRVRAADSHYNYHLGFRCCKSLGDEDKTGLVEEGLGARRF